VCRRFELVERQIKYRGFGPYFDSRPEEKAFMRGEQHGIEPDGLLPAATWAAFKLKLEEARKSFFLGYLEQGLGKKRAQELSKYPEFVTWFGEYLNQVNPSHWSFVQLMHMLGREPDVLKEFVSKSKEPYLKRIDDEQFERFFEWTAYRAHPSIALWLLLDPSKKLGVEMLKRWAARITTPSGSTNQKERKRCTKQRRKVTKAIRVWERTAA
jgi:hypothetical protein